MKSSSSRQSLGGSRVVPIGHARWFVDVAKSPAPRGEVEYRLGLVPQARVYRTLVKEWHGLHCELVERDVEVTPLSIVRSEPRFEVERVPAREVKLLRQMADELASEAVNRCMNWELCSGACVEKAAAICTVQFCLMRRIELGVSETPDLVDSIDLVPVLRDAFQQGEIRRQEEEERRREGVFEFTEAWQAQVRAAMALLDSYLSPTERGEMKLLSRITVCNAHGEFCVPLRKRGLVQCFVNGTHVADYCLVFQDRSIPLGDEVLMKIALLKVDVDRFLAVANKKRPACDFSWTRR